MTTPTPYGTGASKREEVELMFDRISPKYDLLNRVFSLGIDQAWRRKVIRTLRAEPVQRVLDVATGTADLALMAARHVPQVTGVDISEGMLGLGREKVRQRGLEGRVELLRADSARLPFADGTFDAVMASFGVRNFEDLGAGLSEMARVTRSGGRILVLEFSRPHAWPIAGLYRFYFHRVMPAIGRLVSRDNAAYTYLPASVDAFPDGRAFLNVLERSGWHEGHARPLSGGIAHLYTARR
ncbi:MAG: bifunctional demethylmenaquinone methyltransferase/2-methoxy-6-polyprenyl-1,4-benzoquinol methylase UbiE [Flavobacteriales bacterium]|nr:bifunctional demethylmenaquinone methyltransferase/2-methoxy-6-polyprenyl-1,4-benzoquinol methylase UbiE [Flavobacteriales bacterium]